MIGIIGAMAVEVENLIEEMSDKQVETTSGISYHIGSISGIRCVVAQCGVGKVAAAVCAQTMILKYQPDAIINVGVAGGIGQSIHIGDIVISRGLVQHDMDTTSLGDQKGLISGINLVTIPADEKLVQKVAATAAEVYGDGVHIGIIATGDQFICDAEKLRGLAEDFDASACEMEGGSIAQVCWLNNVKFAVIRAISDNADEDANVDFAAFAVTSAHKITQLIVNLLPTL